MSLVMNKTTGGSSGSTLTPSGGGSPKGGMPNGGCSKSSPTIFQKGSLGSDFSKTPDIFAESWMVEAMVVVPLSGQCKVTMSPWSMSNADLVAELMAASIIGPSGPSINSLDGILPDKRRP